MIPLHGKEGSRAFDAAFIEAGVPSLLLMENAGRGAAEAAVERLLDGDAGGKRVVVVCGTGNNGGDGLVVARRLCTLGATVRVLLVGDAARFTPDARSNADAWAALSGTLEPWAEGQLDEAQLVVDALYGTGLSRALEGTAAKAVQELAQCTAPVLALDVPSGLDADTGHVRNDTCVRAALTVTFGFAKPGLYTPRGREHAGRVVRVDIGVPARVQHAPVAHLLEARDVREALVPRRAGAHKNANGHVLVVGGSPGKIGAPQLAAHGALRAGAGLVSVASWDLAQLGALPPSVMQRPLHPSGELDLDGIRALVVGMGLGTDEKAARVLEELARSELPMVLDADAFTWAKGKPERFVRGAPTVLTPHPAELARVLGLDTKAIEADRFAAVVRAAEATGAVVVLKGAHTLIAAPGSAPLVSPFAEPVLGAAGSGDLLAGIIGAQLASGTEPLRAAWLGVWLHAAAGVRAATTSAGPTDRGIAPPEMADRLPEVVAELLAAKSRG